MKKTITIITLMLAAVISEAQLIPNSGFENWTSMAGGTYFNPDGWGNMNNTSAIGSVFTCEQGAPGAVGSYYLKLTSKTSLAGVVPGIAVSGVIDSATQTAKSGFAYSARPASLTGKWQHMIYGSTQGFIDVKLTRWDAVSNARVTVASAHSVLVGMAMSWANFTIPLTYADGNYPDTCIIVLAASESLATATNLDYLWVDNLAFTGTVAGIDENSLNANISVFPNPASSNLMVDLSSLKNQKVSLKIVDMQGKLVKSIESVVATSNVTIDIADLSTGNYMLNVVTSEGTLSRKFIKK